MLLESESKSAYLSINGEKNDFNQVGILYIISDLEDCYAVSIEGTNIPSIARMRR